MFSWPQLPSISLPSTIQRRFVSFVLKKSLGHLVRPGQLDPEQIDAQIGSGYVEVNDIQLDNDAINSHLSNLPIPFRLEGGSIDKITVRIPWHSLFSAPFTLSLTSLCLQFVIIPHSDSSHRYAHATDELAESVASVAESFINDELSERDNQDLRESLHPELHSYRPPGSIDPFLSTEELDFGEHTRTYDHGEGEEDNTAPSTQGVSLLATQIERLLAKFEFESTDTMIRFILPQKAEFNVRLGKLVYSTADPHEGPESPVDRPRDYGELRTIKMYDLTVSSCNRTSLVPQVPTARQRSPSPVPSSDGEDENEEAMMMMSQSLAFLPPRPSSRPISPESSMYHSATSSIRDASPVPVSPLVTSDTVTSDIVEEKILSLGAGSDPVVLTLMTPALVSEMQGEPHRGGTNATSNLRSISLEGIRLALSIGPVAVALNPSQMLSLLSLSSAITTHPSFDHVPKRVPRTPSSIFFDFTLTIKSITLLLLQSPNPQLSLQDFFTAHSGLPTSPRIPHIRVQLEMLQISRGPQSSSTSPTSTTKNIVKALLDEVSVFAFFAPVSGADESWLASPVLVPDKNLGSQYNLNDGLYPAFGVSDWRDGGAAKVSQWRVRPPQPKRRSLSRISSSTESPRTTQKQVMKAQMDLDGVKPAFEADLTPLHLFLDVGFVDEALKFLREVAPSSTVVEGMTRNEDLAGTMDETSLATPRVEKNAFWDKDAHPVRSNETSFILRIPLLRIQVRAPPIARVPQPRSSALIIDVHGVQVMQRDETPALPRHSASVKSYDTKVGLDALHIIKFNAMIVASALPGETIANTFFSIGSQQLSPSEVSSASPTEAGIASSLSLPYMSLRFDTRRHHLSATISASTASNVSLEAHFPSVHVTISKPVFDGLAFLADEVAQHVFGESAGSDASGRSRNPSMIGSRFFVERSASTGSSENGIERKSEITLKISVIERASCQVTLLVPRSHNAGKARPLRIGVSHFDLLAEVKPAGKDETVVSLRAMDLNIIDTTLPGEEVTIIGLPVPHSMKPSPVPLLKLRFISALDSDTGVKESRLKITVSGFSYLFTSEYSWLADLGLFVKTPEGVFDSVVPSERTRVAVKVTDGSFRLLAPKDLGSLAIYVGELDCSADLIGDSPETLIHTMVHGVRFLFIDDKTTSPTLGEAHAIVHHDAEFWKHAGYALVAELDNFGMRLRLQSHSTVNNQVHISNMKLKLHACADTISAVGSFASDFGTIFHNSDEKPSPSLKPISTSRSSQSRQTRDAFATVDENTFRRIPDVGPAPDMIRDDLPTNLEYLDASFGAAAGFRELREEDLFEQEDAVSGCDTPTLANGIIANLGGETIRMFGSQGLNVVEGHFEKIIPEAVERPIAEESKLSLQVRSCDLSVSLYDGYDWARTRKTIEDEMKAMRRRLVKIRQLLASGQVPDDSIEGTSTILFNSVHIGLSQDLEDLEPGALIAAIDEELGEDEETETGSLSSWQSFKRKDDHETLRTTSMRGKRLMRSQSSRIDFCLAGVQAEMDQYNPGMQMVSKILVTVRDLEILDHIRTSTWRKFLTQLRVDFRGNIRETASDMVRAELRIVRPVPELPTEEARLRAKILPIKLHVDQDALDFMKKFFSFESPNSPKPPSSPQNELYFQHVEVFPVDIKLDYKPKRVDYRALREGKTIELMNFFHFDGAEITLRHITLSGIVGWPRLFETLNDLWTPDVKTHQLSDIISGVSPVRSLVNVGSGIADLVLLPIAQYKKDKRVVRGVQKGTTSFVKSTAMEAIKLGARLATGTQVILEQAETVLGGQGQFRDTVTAEALQTPIHSEGYNEDETAELISKYADQPLDVREGMQTAYKSLAKNLNTAAQTILAVPMEVYERSGTEGPVRAVVRAVPIAVLKPMIGASEAVSKTLFGLRNTMDPEIRHENEAKYKKR